METIIVEICIGITGNVSDFVLPAHVPVQALISELIKLIEQVFPYITFDHETPILYEMDKGSAIPMHLSLAQAGIRDSSRLLLV
ncbi:MAG: EsaB/YukD family protein [Clostridia bacterium]|nr:EsaB/YukD family protein [Clostridia bacterium]